MTTASTADIAAAVAARGYLSSLTQDEIIARQLVKLIEEIGEAAQVISCADPVVRDFLKFVDLMGRRARIIFDLPALTVGATVDVPALLGELPDLVVPIAVAAHYAGVDDVMALAVNKAWRDVERGVRLETILHA